MKPYELYFFRKDILMRLQEQLSSELEAAEAFEAEAWKRYEALTQAEYEAFPARWDAEVDVASRHVRELREQLASTELAVNACTVLETEIDFLINSKVL